MQCDRIRKTFLRPHRDILVPKKAKQMSKREQYTLELHQTMRGLHTHILAALKAILFGRSPPRYWKIDNKYTLFRRQRKEEWKKIQYV